MRMRLERTASKLQRDSPSSINKEVKPSVISRECEALQWSGGGHSHPHQAHTHGGDHSATHHGRAAVDGGEEGRLVRVVK